MARTVMLSKLRGLARLYSDQRPKGNSTFIPDSSGDATLNDLINLALLELYDVLVAARGAEYYAAEYTRASLSDDTGGNPNAGQYTLPADFYELLGPPILEWSSRDHEPVPDYASYGERVLFENSGTWARWSPKAYRLRAGYLTIVPKPTSAVTIRYQYVPTPAVLSADGDTFDGVNGWEKLIALRTAIEMRAIAKLPAAELNALYAKEMERVERLASERDANAPARVQDVYPERTNRIWWPRGRWLVND